jgi:hypothetical protein
MILVLFECLILHHQEACHFGSLLQDHTEPIQLQEPQQEVQCHHDVEYMVAARTKFVRHSIPQDMENISNHFVSYLPRHHCVSVV